MTEKAFHRPIRSFVKREGRLTSAQQKALDTLWPKFGIESDDKIINLTQLFHRSAPRIIEIGFGNGSALATIAQQQPESDFIGIEVHRPGVGQLLNHIEAMRLGNLRVVCGDAVPFLQQRIEDNSLDKVQLFFPDPWHKKRHHKRRIIQPQFLELLSRKLTPTGQFHLATDWEDYAVHMLHELSSSPHFTNCAQRDYIPRPSSRPLTKFEKRGKDLGHNVWDLLFQNKKQYKNLR